MKVVEDFKGIHFPMLQCKGRVVDSNMVGFSGNWFAYLVYYLVGDVCMGW